MVRIRSRRSRTCKLTGLRLIPSKGQGVWRIAKFSLGALNPPQRPVAGSPESWGRFDVPGHRTVYAAEPRTASYAEILAYLSPAVGVRQTRLSEMFDDTDADDPQTVLDAIRSDWGRMFSIEPEKIVFGWREARRQYPVTLPALGWFVDIEHHDSITALNRQMSKLLSTAAIPRLTRAHLTGDGQQSTTQIAEWVWKQELADGTRPHGIVYSSKHGSGWRCWAIWLRRVDDGLDSASEPTTAGRGSSYRRLPTTESWRRYRRHSAYDSCSPRLELGACVVDGVVGNLNGFVTT